MSFNLIDILFATIMLTHCIDLYQNSCADHVLKPLALALSCVSILSFRLEACAMSMLLWIIAVASADIKYIKVISKKEKPTPQKSVSTIPDAGKQLVNDSLEKFIHNLNADHNCDKKPWKLEIEKDGIRVYSSELVGAKSKRWKVLTTIKAPSLDSIVEEVIDFNKRASTVGGWDSAVKNGRIDREWENGKYSIAIMSTNAAAGGVITSREFVDVRLTVKHPENPELCDGGVIYASVGIDPKTDPWLHPFPKLDRSATLGKNYSGGGIKIYPSGESNTYHYVMVNNLDLKGWLPVSLVNSATADALIESHQLMHTHLRKKFGNMG